MGVVFFFFYNETILYFVTFVLALIFFHYISYWDLRCQSALSHEGDILK